MVQLSTVQKKNSAFLAEQHTGLTAVFVGATSGIGQGTLDALTSLLVEPKLYIVGRSASQFEAQKDKLRTLNPKADIIFIEAEISRLGEVQRVCRQISDKESKVDYLCMSAGYLPVGGPQESEDGLEKCFTLSYYARLLFVRDLLPLLLRSPRPRVLSILNGGKEGKVIKSDLGLDDNWSMLNVINHTSTFTTLVFDRLANQNRDVAFIHSAPGQVRTDIESKTRLASDGMWQKMVFYGMRTFVSMLHAVKGVSVEESGQRHAYILTSDRFGPGAWCVNSDCDEVPFSDLVKQYQAEGLADKVWDFTNGVWREHT